MSGRYDKFLRELTNNTEKETAFTYEDLLEK
jgi:hypothetical protein